jgi:hypothetical protein
MQRPFRVVLSIAAFFIGISTVAAQMPSPTTEAALIAAGNKPLTAAQIMSMFVGNTIVETALANIGNISAGGVAKTFYRDAKLRITVPQGGPRAGNKLQSKWWMEGDLQCGERVLTGSGSSCRSLYQVGSSLYACGKPAGNCNLLVRIVPGNPDGI